MQIKTIERIFLLQFYFNKKNLYKRGWWMGNSPKMSGGIKQKKGLFPWGYTRVFLPIPHLLQIGSVKIHNQDFYRTTNQRNQSKPK